MAASKFTHATRAQVITLTRSGHSVEEACGGAGIARSTFQGWMRRGARPSETGGPYAGFRAEMELARAREVEETLDADEVIGLLEDQARAGSIKAMLVLLERPWEKKRDRQAPEQPEAAEVEYDAFDELEQDELAARRAARPS